MHKPLRMVVAMSGGVDSAVAAALLVEQGHEVIGITLQLWDTSECVDGATKRCCSVRDTLDAKAVAKRLGIAHHVVDLIQPFRRGVIDYFTQSYAQGLTPNPCVECNNTIKFGELASRAAALGADAVATGHYAQIVFDETRQRYAIRESVDRAKDQSYVLFGLTQEQLARTRLPVGGYLKAQIRAIAKRWAFPVAEKPDSQEICFIPRGDKNAFLRERLPGVRSEPGEIVDTDGRVLGRHQGLLGYTIGQREGLGIATGRRLYVIRMEPETNRLVVGAQEALGRRRLIAERVNWMAYELNGEASRVTAKIRAHHPKAAATARRLAGGRIVLEFDEPQFAVTPGQSVVLYDDDVVVGGGWIAAD